MRLPQWAIRALWRWAQRVAARRKHDFHVGDDADPYLKRWWVVPRNRLVGNVYLHHFLKSDDDEALHDHPYLFNISILLAGEYIEHTIKAGGVQVARRRRAGAIKLRGPWSAHRIELPPERAMQRAVLERQIDIGDVDVGKIFERPPFCATIFITGPVVRRWGFHCPRGWVHWKVFKQRKPDGAPRAGLKYGCGE